MAQPVPPSTLLVPSLLVISGGGAGAWLRFMTGRITAAATGPDALLPWATLACNSIGSIAMGLLAGWLARHDAGAGAENLRLLLGVGVLGGYTTFSAFSLEVVGLVERGAVSLAMLYVAASLLAGCVGLFAGLLLMRGSA